DSGVMYCRFSEKALLAIVVARTITAFACRRLSRSSLARAARSATRCAPHTPSPAPAKAERNALAKAEFAKLRKTSQPCCRSSIQFEKVIAVRSNVWLRGGL